MTRRIVAAALLAVSCLQWPLNLLAGETPDRYVLPEAQGLAMEQLARVVAVPGPNHFSARFVALFDATKQQIKVRKFPSVSVEGEELVLTPATYTFSVACTPSIGSTWHMPVSMDLAAGHTYSIWCLRVPGSAPVVRFKDQTHSEWQLRSAEPAPAGEGQPQEPHGGS